MCNVKKYEKIYKDIKTLQPEDTLQLVFGSGNRRAKKFL